VRHRGGWCVCRSQPKGVPRYRDTVKTLCDHVVTLPWDTERGVADCPECLGRTIDPKPNT
jgi:hypothetical protein